MTYMPASGGGASTGNTSTTPLGSSATFTGTGELNFWPDVGVSCFADQAGTLYFDFSNDNSNWRTFPTAGFTVTASIHEFHIAVKLGRYFRVRFVNGSSAQSTFQLYTYYGTFAKPNAPLNQAIGSDSDAETVKAVISGAAPSGSYLNVGVSPEGFLETSDFLTEVVRGNASGITSEVKFGFNRDVDAGVAEDVWIQGGTLSYLTSAETMEIASGDADDDGDPAADGAQTVYIEGLDGSYDVTSETVTMNGMTDVTTSNSYLRVQRMYVVDVGATGANEGAITATATTAGTVQAGIEALKGQSQKSQYTVPDGYTAYVVSASGSCGVGSGSAGDREAQIELQARLWDGSAYSSWRTRGEWTIRSSTRPLITGFPLTFPERTDIRWRATPSTNNSTSGVRYSILLIAD